MIDLMLAVLRWAIANPAAGIPLALAGRGAFVYFKPFRTCRWCRPGGLIGGAWLIRHLTSTPGRPRRRRGCWRCKGRRLTRRWGAWHVHKVKDSLIQAWDERGSD